MKKYLFVFIFALLAVSGLASATGTSYKGSVSLSTIGDTTYLYGTMNIRHNADASGSPYIYAFGYINSTITFAARTSDGVNFSCYVYTSDPLYNEAVDIKNSLRMGSMLRLGVKTGTTKCDSIDFGTFSVYLD